eukprot:TRINITY_DN6754_c0_g1_i1.p1 TRINITY_DN6754_c0_g1~~TRINITY_DN6754_c0_g1_i1.p1  ORF type:complete len:545 (+),score=56.94 TRINITY_DN6754_c0_g1_i1:129-1763(+)
MSGSASQRCTVAFWHDTFKDQSDGKSVLTEHGSTTCTVPKAGASDIRSAYDHVAIHLTTFWWCRPEIMPPAALQQAFHSAGELIKSSTFLHTHLEIKLSRINVSSLNQLQSLLAPLWNEALHLSLYLVPCEIPQNLDRTNELQVSLLVTTVKQVQQDVTLADIVKRPLQRLISSEGASCVLERLGSQRNKVIAQSMLADWNAYDVVMVHSVAESLPSWLHSAPHEIRLLAQAPAGKACSCLRAKKEPGISLLPETTSDTVYSELSSLSSSLSSAPTLATLVPMSGSIQKSTAESTAPRFSSVTASALPSTPTPATIQRSRLYPRSSEGLYVFERPCCPPTRTGTATTAVDNSLRTVPSAPFEVWHFDRTTTDPVLRKHWQQLSLQACMHGEQLVDAELVYNKMTIERFQAKQREFERANIDTKVETCYHGTRDEARDSIYARGLLVCAQAGDESEDADMITRRNVAYGPGIYTSLTPTGPFRYAQGDARTLLVAKVLCGLRARPGVKGVDSWTPARAENWRVLKSKAQVLVLFRVKFASKGDHA